MSSRENTLAGHTRVGSDDDGSIFHASRKLPRAGGRIVLDGVVEVERGNLGETLVQHDNMVSPRDGVQPALWLLIT